MRWTLQAASAAARGSSRSGWRKCTVQTMGTGIGSQGASIWPASCASQGQRPLSASAGHWAKAKAKASPRQVPKPREVPKEAPTEEKATLLELLETRKTPFIALGLAAAVIGGYIVMLVISMTSTGPADAHAHAHDCSPSGRPLDLRQGKISALMFDNDLNRPERLMGVTKLRKLMGGLARGHVLEVAVGTGRNIEYVDWEEIKAVAPPPSPAVQMGEQQGGGGDGNGDGGGEGEVVSRAEVVKSNEQLEADRIARRLEKGEKGMILPGDETPEVLSYTGVDVSTDVLEVAWGKLRKAVPELIQQRRRRSQDATEADKHQPAATPSKSPSAPAQAPATTGGDEVLAANIGQGRIRLYKSDAQLRLPAPPAMLSHDSSRVLPAPCHYDTILQNFGLCSVSDPGALLANMASVLRPASGRIYLLEHGRGSYGWLNRLLDKFAPAHFQRYGCWWNRDIEDIVKKAEEQVPGLEVVRIERPLWLQGGTMLWIELKVNPDKIRGDIGGKQA